MYKIDSSEDLLNLRNKKIDENETLEYKSYCIKKDKQDFEENI
ncbi:UNVERIFIED_CONTAM: hypothetical protein O8I53_08410 [Campylobacter lari]